MKALNALVIAGVSVLLWDAAVSAQPYGFFRAGGYNPETGTGGSIAGVYNPTTGARGFSAGRVDATAGRLNRTTRYYNPSTNQGFTSVTSGDRGQGITTQINTLQNGSYTCFGSQTVRFNCSSTQSEGL